MLVFVKVQGSVTKRTENEHRESLFAGKGSEEMRTSETETAE